MSTYERDPQTGELKLISGMRSIDDVKAIMLEMCYPVGSIYISTKNVSPQTFLGGTWKTKSGYMLRGATSGVTFNSNTNDGGADSVTVSSVASHNHTQNEHGHTLQKNVPYGIPYNMTSGKGDTAGGSPAYGESYTPFTIKNATATNIANGADYTVNTLPKYKNVYIWERTE